MNMNGKLVTLSIDDFPYVKPSVCLKKAINWLNKHTCKSEFDFPNYGGMPKSISDRLSSDEVDWLQSQLYKERE